MHTFLIVFCVLSSSFGASVPKPAKAPIIEPRIINGHLAEKTQFPWQVALKVVTFSSTTWCGGALISNRWVLTAGHCVQTASRITVRLGSVKLEEEDPNREILGTVQWVLHEQYNTKLDNDIAVVFLPRNVTFNAHIQPIALASTPPATGTKVKVSGWGLTKDSETKASPTLNYVNLTTISDSSCVKAFGIALPKGASCAQSQKALVQGTCEGDSGGAIVNGFLHVGIVSFGHPDGCERGKPTAFARTDLYRKWIKEKTGV